MAALEDPPPACDVRHHYSCVMLLTDQDRLIGHLRDDLPAIDNPGKVAFFGGSVEEGESPRDAAWRELTLEETNLRLPRASIKHFRDDVSWRPKMGEWEVRHFFYARITEPQLQALAVYEGAGYVVVSGPEDERLIEDHREIVAAFLGDVERQHI